TGFQAVMAKAALKVRGIMECTTMRLPNIGPNDEQIEVVRDGLRASGLIPE
ncbi:4-hydroxy-tetrahydrodipicolinate synthase, partial [Bifidobacterium bifidum]